jgi:hypothetical protein
MNPQEATPVSGYKRFFQVSLVILAFIFVVKVMLVSGTAQSTTDERVLEDKVPKHLPIKVKLKKEKEKTFKDLKNEKWARALELEVTNTGDKPIYSLSFILEMPEISSGGFPIVFTLDYGSVRMGTFKNKPGPDDIPIKPGETYVLKIIPGSAKAFEEYTVEENWPNPKKVILVFQIMDFGDGTGFEGTTGVAVSYPQNQQSRSDNYKPPHKSTCRSPQWRQAALSNWADTFEILPASFSPVNFLSAESSQPDPFNLLSQPQDCCSGTGSGCWFTSRYSEYNCYGCPPQNRYQPAVCGDPEGACRKLDYVSRTCTIPETGKQFLCLVVKETICVGTTPTPTPTPTPSPSPTRTPACLMECFCYRRRARKLVVESSVHRRKGQIKNSLANRLKPVWRTR